MLKIEGITFSEWVYTSTSFWRQATIYGDAYINSFYGARSVDQYEFLLMISSSISWILPIYYAEHNNSYVLPFDTKKGIQQYLDSLMTRYLKLRGFS